MIALSDIMFLVQFLRPYFTYAFGELSVFLIHKGVLNEQNAAQWVQDWVLLFSAMVALLMSFAIVWYELHRFHGKIFKFYDQKEVKPTNGSSLKEKPVLPNPTASYAPISDESGLPPRQ